MKTQLRDHGTPARKKYTTRLASSSAQPTVTRRRPGSDQYRRRLRPILPEVLVSRPCDVGVDSAASTGESPSAARGPRLSSVVVMSGLPVDATGPSLVNRSGRVDPRDAADMTAIPTRPRNTWRSRAAVPLHR